MQRIEHFDWGQVLVLLCQSRVGCHCKVHLMAHYPFLFFPCLDEEFAGGDRNSCKHYICTLITALFSIVPTHDAELNSDLFL